jgi:hypothetical protein
MKITACNETFYNAAVWYANALGIADHEFDLTIDYADSVDMVGAAQILYHKGVAVITMNTTQDESDDELELLAHEMVHLKQYVTGQMIDLLLTGVVIWEGTAYDACTDANSWAYWNAPWELEAFSRQRGLNWMRTVKNVA